MSPVILIAAVGAVMLPSLLLLLILLLLIAVPWTFIRRLRRRAARFGYNRVFEYLRAVPRDDAQKADAVDLALLGGVICALGYLLPPLILLGLVPLYYGVRKLILIAIGIRPESQPPSA